MVEFRPAGLGGWFWVGFGAFVLFSTICLFFPSFNDDLGTMPTRRPYSWKKIPSTEQDDAHMADDASASTSSAEEEGDCLGNRPALPDACPARDEMLEA